MILADNMTKLISGTKFVFLLLITQRMALPRVSFKFMCFPQTKTKMSETGARVNTRGG